ncbi:MAG: D-Ala-D-Ala carboxypeptidase family metallohydrolase [Hyphomonadaceae bacterium]
MARLNLWRPSLIAVAVLVLACSNPAEVNADTFDSWLAAYPQRQAAFARFEAMLAEEGVSGVIPAQELWLVDQIRPQCAQEPYVAPPEAAWRNLVPALRYIRDHVKPAIGEVRVVSGYRDEAFNTCIRGASGSAHRAYYALDLVPVDAGVSREDLIALLCPIHETDGRRAGIGMGIYSARRFHIDARSYRGWGHNHRSATFPCVTER